MTALFEAGAKDVHYVPCFMKKSRPAYILRIIVSEDKLPQVEDAVFRNTTTIGLRKFPVQRTCLKRETVSVILQVGSYKLRGKRIFLMAPLHHHFEQKGWHESQVIVRFWVITIILVFYAYFW